MQAGCRSTLARIRELRREPTKGDRLSYAAIAARLYAESLSTRTGRPWASGTVDVVFAPLGPIARA